MCDVGVGYTYVITQFTFVQGSRSLLVQFIVFTVLIITWLVLNAILWYVLCFGCDLSTTTTHLPSLGAPLKHDTPV